MSTKCQQFNIYYFTFLKGQESWKFLNFLIFIKVFDVFSLKSPIFFTLKKKRQVIKTTNIKKVHFSNSGSFYLHLWKLKDDKGWNWVNSRDKIRVYAFWRFREVIINYIFGCLLFIFWSLIVKVGIWVLVKCERSRYFFVCQQELSSYETYKKVTFLICSNLYSIMSICYVGKQEPSC